MTEKGATKKPAGGFLIWTGWIVLILAAFMLVMLMASGSNPPGTIWWFPAAGVVAIVIGYLQRIAAK